MTHRVVGMLRVVAIVLFTGWVLQSSASQAAETAAAPAGKDAPAAAGDAAKPASGGGAASEPAQQAAPSGPSKSECEARVAKLTGKDAAALRAPEVKALAQTSPGLAVCGAVVRDSDEPCSLLEDAQAKACRKTRSIFHELRNPKGHGYIFTDAEYQECKKDPKYASVCDAIREALDTVDQSKCPTTEPFQSVCRASVTLNPALCPSDDESCRKDIARWRGFGEGLQKLRTSGTPEQQTLSAAALGEPDACKSMAKPAIDSCSGAASTPPAPDISHKAAGGTTAGAKTGGEKTAGDKAGGAKAAGATTKTTMPAAPK